MRRKYFMRGLGVGIIITALVFTIALVFKGNQPMTDGEIIQRARELGMVQADNTLSNTETKDSDKESDAKAENNDEETNDSAVPDTTVDGETNGSENDSANNSANDSANAGESNVTVETLTGDDVKPAPNNTTSPTAENRVTESAPGVSQTTGQTSSSENIVSFSIRSGENSSVVAANLYRAGLITNPTQFDDFLEANGYDKNLRPGTYSIRSGSSNETIAKTLTGR